MGRPTLDRLHELFIADFEAGKLYWRNTSRSPINGAGHEAGDEVGCKNNSGYLQVYIRDGSYFVHRILWAMHYGRWPEIEIDHINRDRVDNRGCNMREADRNANATNSAQSDNKELPTGVFHSVNGKKLIARIRIGGKLKHLGTFDTPEKASSAYQKALTDVRQRRKANEQQRNDREDQRNGTGTGAPRVS
jgi:hypothetical protein